MKKIIKRTVSLIMILVVAACTGIQGFALEKGISGNVTQNANSDFNNQLISYASEVLPYYLTAQGMSISKLNISQPYPLYSSEGAINGRFVFLIFDNTDLIGTLNILMDGKKQASTYEVCDYDAVNKAYATNEDIAFYASNGNFIMVKNNSYEILYSSLDAEKPTISTSCIALNKVKTLDVDHVAQIAAITPPTAYNIHTRTPYVANDKIKIDSYHSKPICWAASVASKVMQSGKASSLTALDVYGKCMYYYNQPDGYKGSEPQGNTKWITIAYSLYGLDTSEHSPLTPASVIEQLQKDNPIHMRLEDKTNENNGVIKHSVILAGLSGTNQNGTYFIVDSNRSGNNFCSYSNGSADITYIPSYSDKNYSWTKAIY